MVEWLAGNRIRGTNLERAGALAGQATPTKIIDGNYTVLTYTADGKFIPKNPFNVEYLVIAGGGGGSAGAGATSGAGAGGFLTATGHAVTAQSYSVTVGAGGANGNLVGSNGANSVFDTVTSIGGGYGGHYGTSGGSGGSGGGSGQGYTGGAGTSGQGNAGGVGSSGGNYPQGGGGGAGAVGETPASSSATVAGAGGIGLQSSITGTATYYAGGGGASSQNHGSGATAGAGGLGGGGQGDTTSSGTATSGTSNSGGGGGSSQGGTGGDGGSGIVILRFLTSGNTYDVEEIGLMQSLASGSVGGWHEIGRTTLGSTGDTIDVAGLADKRYLMILGHTIPDGTAKIQHNYRVGNGTIDTSSIYANRYSQDGGTDIATGINQNASLLGSGIEQGAEMFGVGYISNLASKEKLIQYHINSQSSAGATAVPIRGEAVSKWTNTSNIMDIIQLINSEVGSYASGSELVVLGWDPADTHTTNFWEELASVELGSATSILSSGVFTAKKYLQVQIFSDSSNASLGYTMRFNSDIVSNYARRVSSNGATPDTTNVSQAQLNIGNPTAPNFGNYFIINNLANEKLLIGHTVDAPTAGAGTAPSRQEGVGKWANTTSQITTISIDAGTGTWDTGSIIKVWGHD